jgi:hypothetical protein
MSLIPFEQLPDHSKLWIFPADRVLTQAERERLIQVVTDGLSEWVAHGSPVRWGHQVLHDQFLMIGVDETHTALTGCSIDSGVSQIRQLEKELAMSFLDNARIFFRDGEAIRCETRPGFQKLAEEGRVDGDTLVFNNVVTSLGELRRGEWEIPVRDSWHAKAFPIAAR